MWRRDEGVMCAITGVGKTIRRREGEFFELLRNQDKKRQNL